MWALSIKHVDEFPNAQDSKALLSCGKFFDFALRNSLEDFFFATAKLKGVHGMLGMGFC